MDLIVTYAIRLWIGAMLLVVLPALLLGVARGTVGILRRLPPLRTSLDGAATRMAAWSDRLQSTFMVLFYAAALWPVLAVALPVAGITWLLLHWLVPDRPPETTHHTARTTLRTLEWPLRLVTVTALAQLLATAVLLWLVKRPTAPVVLGVLDGDAVHIDRLVVITASAFLPAGFGLLLSGAWGSALGRSLVIAVLLISMRPPVWSGVPLVLWLALVAGLGGTGTLALIRSRSPSPTALGFVMRALGIMAALGAFLGATAVALTASGRSFPAWLDSVISAQVFMVAPVLFLAGVDFAGIGSGLGRLLTRWTLRAHTGGSAALVAMVAAGLSAVFAAWLGSIDPSGLWSVLLLALVGAVFAVALTLFGNMGWLGRFEMPLALVLIIASVAGVLWLFFYTEWRLAATAVAVVGVGCTFPLIKPRAAGTWASAGVTMAAIAVMATAMAGAREVVVLTRAVYEIPPSPRTTTFRVEPIDTPAGRVSAAIPTFWTPEPRRGHLYYGEGPDPYATGSFLTGLTSSQEIDGTGVDALEPTVAVMLDGYPFPDLTFTDRYDTASGEWRGSQATVIRDGRRYLVDVFDRQDRGGVWLLVFVSGERYERYFAPTLARIVGSWRFDGTATAPEPVPPPDLRRRVADLAGFGFLPVLFAPLGYWLLFWRKSTPTGTQRDHAGLLAIFVAGTAVMFLPDTALMTFWRGETTPSNPLATLQLILAATTAVMTVLFAVGRQLAKVAVFLRELASANVALLFMAAIYAFYGAVIPLGDRRVEYEVAVFLGALVLDLVTSGRDLTSGDSDSFPRGARVLSYLGYLVVVSTIALFISTQTVASTGESLPKLAESEDIVRQGLVWLGAPVLLLRAVLRWAETVRLGQLAD